MNSNEEGTQVASAEFDVRAEVLRALLERVAQDPYPSTTMMDKIEELLTPDDVPRYARLLLAHVANDRFPSISLVDRLTGLSVG